MFLRDTAREIFLQTLAGVRLPEAMQRRIAAGPHLLTVDSTAYDLDHFNHVLLIGIGKAAVPMAETLLATLRHLLTAAHTLEGLIVGTSLPTEPDPRLLYRLGSHPLPDHRALQAADLTLALLHRCTQRSLVFFLLSGGASAMIERPLDPAIGIADLAAFHQALVHSGLAIGEMNTLRKHLSAVKGGRLAAAAVPATICTLLVSDVPPSRPEIIGSGPSLPDPSTVADCRALFSRHFAPGLLPASISAWFDDPACPETPKPDHSAFAHASAHMLLSSDDLVEAARTAASARGFHVEIDLTCDEWDFRDAATHLLARLQQMASGPRPACLISAGELAVRITGMPGLGGRNQQFALHCAREIVGWPAETAILSAGSDGIDGNSPAAGAVVDTTTLRRAAARGLDVDHALASFNSYPLLHALGDTVSTGPTGNNLRDLRLLLLA